MTGTICEELKPPLCASSVEAFLHHKVENMIPAVIISGLEHIRVCSAQDEADGQFDKTDETGMLQATSDQIARLNEIRVLALAQLNQA